MNVKLHRFLPSGREVWTAVGREGDQYIDDSQPYCSCRDFHFKTSTGKGDECYHLTALRLAKESGMYETVEFQDSEYTQFLKALLDELPHGGGKRNKR